jgi:DNA polymerase III subunit alpha
LVLSRGRLKGPGLLSSASSGAGEWRTGTPEERIDTKFVDVTIPVRRDAHGHETPVVVRKVQRTRRLPQRSREMTFASLHHHTTFSYGDGYALPEAHVRRATEIGLNTMAVTEHGNISSHVQMEVEAKKAGVKPIYGVELYTGELGEKATQRKNHLTILAENADGYQNLLQLVTKTYAEGFYYEPTADGPMLARHKDGLVVLSGCQGSALFTAAVGGKHIAESDASLARARRVASQFKRALGDAYYIELQAFPELEKTRLANPMLAQIAEELKIPYVVTFDCHYTVPEEKEMQKILHNLRPGERRSMEDMAREWGYDSNLCPPWTDSMVVRKLVATGLTKQQAIRAIMATRDVADRCVVELPSLPMVRYPLPAGYASARDLWRDWLKDGWHRRGCDSLPTAARRAYANRLRHEMKIIEDKDFVDYFLVVADALQFAKDHDIGVGPARGSSAGSLACWLLRITEVNPMLYPDDLIFERFIDVTRQDLPDIDVDFNSERRSEVYDYLVAKYGAECVGNVGTFTKFKGKNSLDAAARVFHVPMWEITKIKDVLIERSSGDLRASATIEDTAEQFSQAREVFEKYPDLGAALDLEGNYAGFGVHSAGLVVSTGPLTRVAATYERVVKGEVRQVISMDKYDAEKKGLLKLDFLGLSNMTAIDGMRKEMGWSLDDLYNIDVHDPMLIEGFHINDVIGIFQFEGPACRYVNGALQPDNFKQVYDVTALGRPGPLHNGAANAYIDIKHGRAEYESLHVAMDRICSATYGQVVYQEQILRILGEIGGFDHTHRAEVRRIISRKIGEQEFNRRWDRFRDGARSLHQMEEDVARRIWMLCITAGSYAFNAAHAVAYAMIASHAMWFKRYEPSLFYKDMLKISDDERQRTLLRDTQRKGRHIKILPPHPAYSGISWERKDGALVAGFKQVPTIGESKGMDIIAHREQHGLDDWDDLLKVKGIGPKTYEKIREFHEKGDDPFGALWLDRAIAAVKEEIASGKLQVPDPTHVAEELPMERGDDIEVVWLGTIYTRNERDLFEFNQAKGAELDMSDPKRPKLDGKPIKDPHLDKWVVMVGHDESEQLGLRVDRWKYPRLRDKVWRIRPGKDLVLVRGVKPGWMPTRQITISDLWIIDPEI